MANGVMANINQQIDFDSAAIVASELGYEAVMESTEETVDEEERELPVWRQAILDEDPDVLIERPPVVTILGHVDHGKTTLLDAIRHANVAEKEAGGITQHIGAYQVKHHDQLITFLDTPGHAAFTAMRARGAQGADIVVLVVAVDDGVMPQTKEAIAHAEAASIPIVVALNKIDKPNADINRTKQQLAEVGLVPDDWDGETIVVPISAKNQTGLDDLMEAILLIADSLDIYANPNGKVIGTVIEAQRDRTKGVLTTLLVQNGTLNVGDIVVAGTVYGRIRAMFDYKGKPIKNASPSDPVSVMGLNDVPQAGEVFKVVRSDKEARTIVQNRLQVLKDKNAKKKGSITLEQLFDRYEAGEVKELRLIIKADVQGSLEPIVSELNQMGNSDIAVKILHAETGNIGENDIMLAAASNAIVIGFNVQADPSVRKMAENEGVSIRTYDIIYRLTEDIEKALRGLLEPEKKETVIGHAEVREVFRISKIGKIAGCQVSDGEIRRNANIRVLRDNKLVFEGVLSSLKHYQEDIKVARTGFECGIAIKGFDEFQQGDILESYILEDVSIV